MHNEEEQRHGKTEEEDGEGQLAEEKVSDDVLTTVMSRVRVSSRGDEASDYDYIAVLDFEANCIPQRGRDAPEWEDL